MSDSLELVRPRNPMEGFAGAAAAAEQPAVASRRCFGFLRGVQDKAVNLEFRRRRQGDSFALPYSWLGPNFFHPSHGIALVFVGAHSYVVTVLGRHLNTAHRDVSLYERGILSQRVLWVAEAAESNGRLDSRAAGFSAVENGADECVVERIGIQPARSDDELWELLGPWHEALRSASASS